jgi:hypothetical protein
MTMAALVKSHKLMEDRHDHNSETTYTMSDVAGQHLASPAKR